MTDAKFKVIEGPRDEALEIAAGIRRGIEAERRRRRDWLRSLPLHERVYWWLFPKGWKYDALYALLTLIALPILLLMIKLGAFIWSAAQAPPGAVAPPAAYNPDERALLPLPINPVPHDQR